MLQAAVASSSLPNIVIIFADDLDADEIGYTAGRNDIWATPTGARNLKQGKSIKAGSAKVYTPAIDSLADQGALFTRFYVNATVCTSSRYCLLTGRLASRGPEHLEHFEEGSHLTLGWNPQMLRSESNLPKELKKLGYRTGIIGKWHNMPRGISPKRGKDDHKANAEYEHTKKVEAKLKTHYLTNLKYLQEGFGWDVVDRMEWGNSIVNLDWQCEGALEFIDNNHKSPFFLYVALPVPHGQYSFQYNDISTLDRRVTSNGLLEEEPGVLPPIDDVYKRVKANGVPKQNAMATHMDDYVAAILAKLDEHGLRDNTLVIFTSDHGSRGKNSVYEGGAKVPMLIAWPDKVKPGTISDSLIGSIDISNTLIEIAGGKAPADMSEDSLSFLPQLLGKPQPKGWRESMLIEAGNSKGVVTRDWKYVANRVPPDIEKLMKARPREVFWTGVDHHNYQNEVMYETYWDADQLFDLNSDLYETTNLYDNPEYRSAKMKMRKEMNQYISSLPFSFGEFGK
ncbi:MAG: sulfatase [Puniceicoccaceae bacterium]